MTRTFISERPKGDGTLAKVEVDDAFVSTVEFANGAIGTLEATRFAAGRKNYEVLEINGERGSIHFNMEKMNELGVFWVGEQPKETQGFHEVVVTEGHHPWIANWWPHGHIIGWEHTFVHELTHFLDCIVNDKEVAPFGASFEDGYRTACVCDAILASAAARRQVDVKY
jgi:predicted dehydrogenase